MHECGILICGSRYYDDYEFLENKIDEIIADLGIPCSEIKIISGHCEGTDQLGERYAMEHHISFKVFLADWERYGKSAGPIRNQAMIEELMEFKVKKVVAFVSNNSKGTLNTIKLAEKRDIPVIQIQVD